MQPLYDCQKDYSPHENDFGVLDKPFHITLKPAAELPRQRVAKLPFTTNIKCKQNVVDLVRIDITDHVGKNSARNEKFDWVFKNSLILRTNGDAQNSVLYFSRQSMILQRTVFH